MACQRLYNACLQERRDAYRNQKVSIKYARQCRELTEIRAAFEEWREIPAWIERSALQRLQLAFEAFFRRVKAGETPGYPRFKARDRYNSFGVPFGNFRIDRDHVIVPKLGAVRFKKYRELRGEPRAVTFVKTRGGKWFVCIACDLGAAPAKCEPKTQAGVDVGLTHFATLSNGETIDNPRFFRSAEELIARRHQALSRKKRGSRSRQRAKILLGKAHDHVRNQRLDFARKLAVFLFARFDLIAYEDLAIARMVHGNLAKSIYDAAWGMTLRCLDAKAEEAGRWAVPVDPAGTTIACSGCAEPVPKDLAERTHRCPRCGLVLDRDHNAALNILARGRRVGLQTEGRISSASCVA